MSDNVKLVWIVERDPHTRKVNANEGLAYDGKVPVGRVSLAPGDPQNRGAWRWTMFGYGRNCRGDRASVTRAGAASSKDEAKAAVERAYLRLLSLHPGNRQAILEHNAVVEESAQFSESSEGLRRAPDLHESGADE